MAEMDVVTLLGFLECTIHVDQIVSKESLQLLRSFIRINSITVSPPVRSLINAIIGEKISVPLRPGKYRINAVLGEVPSDTTEIEIKAGQVLKINFYFGKKP